MTSTTPCRYVYRTVSLFVITQYVGKNVDSQRMAAAILASEKLSKVIVMSLV